MKDSRFRIVKEKNGVGEIRYHIEEKVGVFCRWFVPHDAANSRKFQCDYEYYHEGVCWDTMYFPSAEEASLKLGEILVERDRRKMELDQGRLKRIWVVVPEHKGRVE